ncbi:MAG: GAF domain-containing protein [Anaerolineales bacterium]|nr:GAF domain-containing protein [Anaerolineales bacterium]
MSEPANNFAKNRFDQRVNYAYRFSLGVAILFSTLFISLLFFGRSLNSDITVSTYVTLGLCALTAIISIFLCRRGMSTTGILLVIASLILLTASRIFIAKGLAVSTGIINIITVAAIAIYTLPRNWIARVISLAFLNAVVTILAEQFITNIPSAKNPGVANAVSIAIGLVFLGILLLRFPRLTLRAKLLVSFIALTILPIVLLGVQTYRATHQLLEDQIKAEVLRAALDAGGDLQTFADSQFVTLSTQARSSDIVNYISLSPLARANSEEEILAQETLKSFTKNAPTYITAYSITDQSGKVVLDNNKNNLGVDYSNQDFYKYVLETRKPYASGLAKPAGQTDYSFYIAAPIFSKSNELIGVYIKTYNASLFQDLMVQVIKKSRALKAEVGFSYIMDRSHAFVLAHSSKANFAYKTYLAETPETIQALAAQGLIDPAQADGRFISQPETAAELQGLEETATFELPSPALDYDSALSTAVLIRNTDWAFVVSAPTSTVTGLIQEQTRNVVVTSIILMALAALAALWAANSFTKPIAEITEVAQSISAGDYGKRAAVHTRDEVGLLADSINVMGEEIQRSIETLESRVQRRTADLSQATQQSDKRAKDLQTIAEISRSISTEKNPEKLLTLVTKTVSERFGFYHVGIFLLSEDKKLAVLRAANSKGGQEMLARKHSLGVGQTGIVGYVTSTGLPRIALDTGADAVFFNNPSLPDTHSEMALPLTTRGTIIGALDVQSVKPNAFTEADTAILSVLADQIAIAIDNSTLLEAAEASVEETKSIFAEYLTEAWQKKAETGVIGYRQTLTGGETLTKNNLALTENGNNGNGNGHSLEVPIKVREQTIGVLNIKPAVEGQEWAEDDLTMIASVAERLGLALDNARLFEETSTRATRERLVADITTKIRGSNNPQEMIKTAMDELKQALGATKVEILQEKNNNSSQDH